MNYITSTQLRTKASSFIDALLAGEEINLIHRSQNLGKVKLIKDEELKVFDSKKVAKIVDEMNLPKLTIKEREKRYREAMIKKHGKYLH